MSELPNICCTGIIRQNSLVFTVDVSNHQDRLPIDGGRIDRAVRMIVKDAAIADGRIGVAVVDDPTIRELNQRHLNHDYATDVLSFPLEQAAGALEGEVIVSADMALATAPEYGWSAEDELLLYVIHGTLHLVGCDDQGQAERRQMRSREKAYLARLGLKPDRASSVAQ
jgi:probable rRNA maturation factor